MESKLIIRPRETQHYGNDNWANSDEQFQIMKNAVMDT